MSDQETVEAILRARGLRISSQFDREQQLAVIGEQRRRYAHDPYGQFLFQETTRLRDQFVQDVPFGPDARRLVVDVLLAMGSYLAGYSALGASSASLVNLLSLLGESLAQEEDRSDEPS